MVVLRFLVLPLRAPLLLLLFGVAVVMGNHWTLLQLHLENTRNISAELFWTVEVTQVLAVVVICTMPDLLMRQVSLLMASSRVLTMIISLLLVVTCGLVLLRANLLVNVLILSSALLLARLDHTRIGVVPPPWITVLGLGSWLMLGIWLGHRLPGPLLLTTA